MTDIYFNFDKDSTDPDDEKIKKLFKDTAHYIKKIEDIFATMNKGDVATVYYTGMIFKVMIERAD